MQDTRASGVVRLYRFGAFEFDARSRELRKNGVRIKLQEQPTQVLSLLLGQAGNVVEREQIQRHLWPDKAFGDFDNAINSAVRKLREALCDPADNPRFVETLSRRGYRFVAPVSPQTDDELPPRVPPSHLTFPPRRIWKRVTLFAVPAAAIVITWVLSRQFTTPKLPDLRVTPLTTYSGTQLRPSFSPDGTIVAFSWDGPDGRNVDIYVKQIGQSDAVRLTTDPARDLSPAWAPDGRSIAALREIGTGFAVLLFPATGGPPREISRIAVGGSTSPRVNSLGLDYGLTLAWSPEGRYLFTSSKTDNGSSVGIVRIDVETGEQLPVTTPPPRASDLDPAVSRHGRELAFARVANFTRSDIWIVSLSAGVPSGAAPRRLTNDDGHARDPVWTADGRDVIFSSDRLGRNELWRLRLPSGTPTRLEGVGGDAFRPAISPSGQQLAFEHETRSLSLWKVSIGSGGSGERKPTRVTSTTRIDTFPHYSPDGKRIAFGSNRSGVHEIWIGSEDGSNLTQLTRFGRGWSGSPRWSPDGRTIVFDSNFEGNWDIWTIRPDGGRPVRLTRNPADEYIPKWSRRGDWIYFSSTRTGHHEIWKIRPDGSSEKQVTNGGGWAAEESADGRYLYYRDLGHPLKNPTPLWRMPVDGGSATKVIDSILGRNFTLTERGIFFPAGPQGEELRFFEFATGAVRNIAAL
ncbi:MAG: winged helix-turn-helix domain-containing protein, partial [Bryobacteraceae bacterium]